MMKKILLPLTIFLLVPVVWNCSNPDTDSKDIPFHVDFENYKLSVDLKLSDLMEDCRLVALETTDESLLPDNTKDEVLQRAVFYTGDENMHVMYWRDDTLFTLKDMHLSPYLIAEHKGKYTVPNMLPVEGDTFTWYDQ